MFGGDPRDYPYPNIVYKQKLAPIPLFNQNLSPKLTSSPSHKRGNSWFKLQSPNATVSSTTLKASPSKPLLDELKTVNNYGRLCDQPFLEFSGYHAAQLLGSGKGKKQIKLDPLQWKNERKKIIKIGTMKSHGGSPTAKHELIRVEDEKINRKDEVVEQMDEIDEGEVDNVTHVDKKYKINQYETIVSFVSLEVVLSGADKEEIKVKFGKNDLKKIYKHSVNKLVNVVLESLVVQNSEIKVKIDRKNYVKGNEYVADESYPEKKEGLSVKLGNKSYKATIKFPYLQASIKDFDYTEKQVLKPIYLANLFEENFNNLPDFLQRFNVPAQAYKGAAELHIDELKALPNVIKKVIKGEDFGGLMIFKSMEITLKNTSEMQPEITIETDEGRNIDSKIRKRRQKDVSNVTLRLSVFELSQLLKCNIKELIETIKESIKVEEGKGFSVEFDKDRIEHYSHRLDVLGGFYPETTEKFNIRFNKFLYETQIRFPTLELYVPETSFKDVIVLTPEQLEDLMDNEFKNMEDYMQYLKKPGTKDLPAQSNKSTKPSTPQDVITTQAVTRQNSEELKGLPNVIKKVIKGQSYGGLLIFKCLEVNLKNTAASELGDSDAGQIGSSRQRKRKQKDTSITAKMSVHQLSQVLGCTVEELVELVKKSVKVEDAKNAVIELDEEKVKQIFGQRAGQLNAKQEVSDKFEVEVDGVTYEAFIKFPTLEIYVPETGFKDTMLVNASQLRDMMEGGFENLENYLKFLKAPTSA